MGMFPASLSLLSLHFSVSIPRTGTTSTLPLSPGQCQGLCLPETHPTIPIFSRELCRSSRPPFSPPPALLLSSLSERSVIEGVNAHAPDSPGRMGSWKLGVVFCCEKAKLPSAAALIWRQLQTSVGPCSTQPINNGISVLTQTDFPQTVREGETE